jgi:hypothetical protein
MNMQLMSKHQFTPACLALAIAACNVNQEAQRDDFDPVEAVKHRLEGSAPVLDAGWCLNSVKKIGDTIYADLSTTPVFDVVAQRTRIPTKGGGSG